MIDLFQTVFSMLDPILIFWAIVLNVIGFHLKKVGLPKAAPPIPLLLYLVAFVPCFGLGWAAADGTGGKAALYALLYGVSNAGLITLPAIWGYDIVHAFTGKTADKRAYCFAWKDDVVTFSVYKVLFYALPAFIGLVLSGCLAFFVFDESIFYSICWALLFGAVAFVIARTVVHILFKDERIEAYAVSVYLLVACGAWLGLILCNTWLWVSLWSAVAVGCVLMAAGTRFLDPVEAGKEAPALVVKEKKAKQKKKETDLQFLKRTVKFRFQGDTLVGDADPDRPLCEIDGVAYTVDEAEAMGMGAISAEGLAYLMSVIEKEEK